MHFNYKSMIPWDYNRYNMSQVNMLVSASQEQFMILMNGETTGNVVHLLNEHSVI